MKRSELSAADQQLLATDLGEFDKVASERIAEANEMYETGFTKLATETADYLDKVFAEMAEMDKKASEEAVVDEGLEKAAEERAKFIERGYFDGLCKLGQDRYGDPAAYFYPFIEEKVADAGANKALTLLRKGKDVAANYGKDILRHARQAKSGLPVGASGKPSNMVSKLSTKERALEGAKAVGKAAAPVGVVGAAGVGAKKVFGKKEEKK